MSKRRNKRRITRNFHKIEPQEFPAVTENVVKEERQTTEKNESVIQKTLSLNKTSKEEIVRKEVIKNNSTISHFSEANKKRVLKILYVLLILLIVWTLLPAVIANSPLVVKPIEKNLSEKFDAKVDVQKVEISNWTLAPKIKISSIDFYEKNTNIFIAYVDNLKLQINPLYLLIGKIKTKKINIGRVDVELPSQIIQRYLLKHKYISKPIFSNSFSSVEQYMSFLNSVIKFDVSNRCEVVEVKSDCEIPFMREVILSFSYIKNLRDGTIKINDFHAGGIRSIQKLNFENGKPALYTLELPIDINLHGFINSNEINIAPIKISVDTCVINAKYSKNITGSFVNIKAIDQNLNRIERLFKTRTKNNKLTDISFDINSHAIAGNAKMITDCKIKIRNGIFRNVPFNNFNMNFNLQNDKILAFDSNVKVWGGNLALNLFNKISTDGLTNLLTGELSASDTDLNACLSELSRIPAKAGGEFNFDIKFEVENSGIAEFINKKLSQLAFTRGTGEISLSNAYLKYFATDTWQETKEIPKIVRRFLKLAANMTGAPLSIPILKKLLKHLDMNKPRTVFAKLFIDNGNLTAPEIQAETSVGTLLAAGTCSKAGDLNYQIQIHLNDDIIDKYGNHPLLSMFLKGKNIELPVTLAGTLEEPNVQLNLTPEQRIIFEERLTEIVTKYVKDKLLSKEEKAEITEENMNFIKKTVKSLIKRFL